MAQKLLKVTFSEFLPSPILYIFKVIILKKHVIVNECVNNNMLSKPPQL